jgi:hypothetical protein
MCKGRVCKVRVSRGRGNKGKVSRGRQDEQRHRCKSLTFCLVLSFCYLGVRPSDCLLTSAFCPSSSVWSVFGAP